MCVSLIFPDKTISAVSGLRALLGGGDPPYLDNAAPGPENGCLCGVDWQAVAAKTGLTLDLDSEPGEVLVRTP